MNKVKMWKAINEYVVACGGDPTKHVYGNTVRQNAVAAVEAAALDPMLVGPSTGPYDEVYYEGVKWLDENG